MVISGKEYKKNIKEIINYNGEPVWQLLRKEIR